MGTQASLSAVVWRFIDAAKVRHSACASMTTLATACHIPIRFQIVPRAAQGQFAFFLSIVFCLLGTITSALAAQCPMPPNKVWKELQDSRTRQWLPMSYQVGNVNGQRILIAKGSIGRNEERKLDQAIRKAGRVDEIWLYSGGGSSRAGMAMGRVIRKRGLATRVPNGAVCFSACSMAFLGGTLRAVDNGGFYGVHMWTGWGKERTTRFIKDIATRLKSSSADQAIAWVRAEIQGIERHNAQYSRERANYLIEMSVSLRLMIPNTETQSQDEYYVCGREARSFNVVNFD